MRPASINIFALQFTMSLNTTEYTLHKFVIRDSSMELIHILLIIIVIIAGLSQIHDSAGSAINKK